MIFRGEHLKPVTLSWSAPKRTGASVGNAQNFGSTWESMDCFDCLWPLWPLWTQLLFWCLKFPFKKNLPKPVSGTRSRVLTKGPMISFMSAERFPWRLRVYTLLPFMCAIYQSNCLTIPSSPPFLHLARCSPSVMPISRTFRNCAMETVFC